MGYVTVQKYTLLAIIKTKQLRLTVGKKKH